MGMKLTCSNLPFRVFTMNSGNKQISKSVPVASYREGKKQIQKLKKSLGSQARQFIHRVFDADMSEEAARLQFNKFA